MRRFSNVIGIDDGAFVRRPRTAAHQRTPVLVVGAVFARQRLDGVLTTYVQQDGADATRRVAQMIGASRFYPQLHGVLLQGIALGGFNVIDIHELHERLSLPVLVVARRQPDMERIRRALLERVRGGRAKWARLRRAGPVEPLANLYVQRAGLSPAQAERWISEQRVHGALPEPVRVAHLIASGLSSGHSRGRA